MQQMATVVVQRSRTYINRFRQIDLYMDGQKVGSIANGQALSFAIPPGPHTLQAKLDWWSSPVKTFTAVEGTTTFSLDGFRQHRVVMVSLLVLSMGHLFMQAVFRSDVLIYILMPGLMLLAGFLIVGRHRYLSLDLVAQEGAPS